MSQIQTREELRARYRSPAERAVKKQLPALDAHCRRFIAHAPFLVLSTSDAQGRCDASPRGSEPGFVHVEDDHTLLIPDWPGNNRLDSLENLLANPRAGVLFLIPGVDETLRVNGTVTLHDDDALRAKLKHEEQTPLLVIRLHVEEAYLHCAKALMRSRLWDPATRIDRAALPTMGEMLRDQLQSQDPPETHAAMLERYRRVLY